MRGCCPRFHHARRQDALRAIERRESFRKPRHFAADGRLALHQHHFVAGVGDVERRLYARHPAADHQRAAGVDHMIDQLVPHLEPGDIIIDGGNSHFPDTTRRTETLAEKGILFIGTGVSGGEEGARRGPSIMPGGNPLAWPFVKPIFQAIAAKVDGSPCCEWVGENGAGHYVKMVHNGIEYGDMQLICEAYQMLKDGLGLTAAELHDVFAEWNAGELDSYLIEITRDIFGKLDEDGTPIVDKILDTAGQKGTGKWTGISSLDLGVPVTLIGEAVYARCLSAMKEERVHAAQVLQRPEPMPHREPQGLHRGCAQRAVLLQDDLLRAGLHAAARGREGVQAGTSTSAASR